MSYETNEKSSHTKGEIQEYFRDLRSKIKAWKPIPQEGFPFLPEMFRYCAEHHKRTISSRPLKNSTVPH